MTLTDKQKVIVYAELEKTKDWIKVYMNNGRTISAARMINRNLELKRLLKDQITVTKFLSTLTNARTHRYFTKLLTEEEHDTNYNGNIIL